MPHDALPVEIFCQIFQYCAHADSLANVRIGQVCARWRAILDHAPRLFQLVVLDDDQHPPARARALAQYFLHHSDGLPFDVHATLHSHDSLLPLLSPFLSALPRWRKCTLAGTREEVIIFADIWSPDAGAPELDALKLNLFDPASLSPPATATVLAPPPAPVPPIDAEPEPEIAVPEPNDVLVEFSDAEDDEEPSPPPPTFRQATTPLTSNLLYMELTATSLPRPNTLSPLFFASLEIKETSATNGGLGSTADPASLLRVLTACPALEFFSYAGTMASPPSRVKGEVAPPVAMLPRLRSLVLHGTLCARILLSFIDAPALRELYLEFLNVDWRFEVRNPYLRKRRRGRSWSVSVSASEDGQASSASEHPSPPSSATSCSPCASPSPAPEMGETNAPIPLALQIPAYDEIFDVPEEPGPSTSSTSASAPPTATADDIRGPSFHTNMYNDSLTDLSSLTDSDVESESGYETGDSLPSSPDRDFSQSPWSDHATGMGVRALLKRSNPPLKVLEMDYADMRTKDFGWLFEHVDSLEEFRIVASDMADRVVGMLAPPAGGDVELIDGGKGKGKARAEDVDVMDGPRIALPRMRALELRYCQRLTGDAILTAVRGREELARAAEAASLSRKGKGRARARLSSEWDDTPESSRSPSPQRQRDRSWEDEEDAYAGRAWTLEEIAMRESGRGRRGEMMSSQTPVRLEDVAIVGCQGFRVEHGEELNELLGERLRLQ
ncbi:hypothetical protein PENSPDRAFT_736736 [Peniophora sp. CONT]|nr:hypothetical protein PENSPDRAFT_736736 [Peniophora sp. CONT]